MSVALEFEPLVLRTRDPFGIARGTHQTFENVLVRLRDGTHVGWGEAAPSRRYGEDAASVQAALTRVRGRIDLDPFALEVCERELARALPEDGAARAALDIALHDLLGKRVGLPLFRLLGLERLEAPPTSFTIGIASREETRRKTAAAASYPILKVKVGFPGDVEAVREVARSSGGKRLVADANEGWSREEALERIPLLRDCGVEWIEQPLPAGDLEGLRRLREQSPIPIVLDESVRRAADLPGLAGCADGINIKLMKCGGIREALRMIHVARALGLKILMGCMIESSIACTAAAHLAGLLDWADLDGAALLAEDPFEGMRLEGGRMRLPEGPGLGVGPRGPANGPGG